MIHDVSANPVTDEIESIDFYQVRMDEKITVRVPLQFTGASPAVKEKGGILIKAMQEIELEALPGKVPHSIQVDLSQLKELNQSLYVKDLSVPSDVELGVDLETVIATVKERAREEEEAKPEIDVESVKVEAEEKKAEREEKRATEAKKQEKEEAKEEEINK